jgi:hypothetical protein
VSMLNHYTTNAVKNTMQWIQLKKSKYSVIVKCRTAIKALFLYLNLCLSVMLNSIPVNPPPIRGSLPRKSLISRMDWLSCAGDINLPHTPFPPARYPPNKKIKYNKILTYILRSIFLEIPHLELPR